MNMDMTPEEKEKINTFLKQIGGPDAQTIDQLDNIRKRAVRTLEEWSVQDTSQLGNMPQEIKDMKMICRYTLLATILGMASLVEAFNSMDMAVEAAFNIGKAQPTTLESLD